MDENKERIIPRGTAYPKDGRLEILYLDEDQLDALIRDTEENWMLHAPAHLKEDTLLKIQQIRSSKHVQLISYSLKVCTAAAAALFILFTTPVFLKPSMYPDALREMPGRTAPGWTEERMETRRTLQESVQEIAGSIYDLSNEIFTGR